MSAHAIFNMAKVAVPAVVIVVIVIIIIIVHVVTNECACGDCQRSLPAAIHDHSLHAFSGMAAAGLCERPEV
jgi:hypothetical protein